MEIAHECIYFHHETSLQPHAIALLRLSLGVMALAHGLTKVFVFTLPGTVGYFESLGLPGFIAYLTILGEVGGGLALILGIYTRWISLAMIPLLLGATSVHLGNGWMFSNVGGGWEFPAFWTVALLVQAGLGGGSFTLSRGVS
ncbi:putative membrane protein [Halomonas citrativorans]|uniref:Membrane protein n=1 Tax=Halomonas citrativorans TaxID=2742612 RepID=A0A1R4I1A5_9GAMM|nr:DoxX family protein [Halomonas citrativorans]SJN13582.1 putative membrane protein [Halomonas citrativorans]